VRRRAVAILVLILASVLSGCGIPADPGGSLERITGGQLRVGASPSGMLVEVRGDDVSGSLAEIVAGFARERDADLLWTVGSEEDLVDALERGELDLAIGGMTDATAWADRASVTRGYPGVDGAGDRSIVILLPLGENRLQAALEEYLDREAG